MDSMKQDELEVDAWALYLYSMKSPVTKEKYTRRLVKFFDWIDMRGQHPEDKASAFVTKAKSDGAWVFSQLAKFFMFQKERIDRREIGAATARNYVKSLKLFCEVADIPVVWTRITRGLPRGKRYADDRVPTLEELRSIMEYPDRRIKAIVLTMCSCGGRLGMWDYLRWGDIVPIEKNGTTAAAKIRIYAGEPEDYISFITSTAYEELKKWMDFRRISGESVSKESWLMRDVWNTSTGPGNRFATSPKKLASSGVKRLIERAIWAQGLRTKLEPGKRRHPFQAVHCMRKWFKTRCELGGMRPLLVEELLSHSTGISDSYFRPTETELQTAYLDVVPSLSIQENQQQGTVSAFGEQTNAFISQLSDTIVGLRREIDQIKGSIYPKQKSPSNSFNLTPLSF
jgi:hypothetical protein